MTDTEAKRHHDDPWDFKLPRSVLTDYDLKCIAYGISDHLHYCTGIPTCRPSLADTGLCAMCGNAMRLVVQAAEPKLRDRYLAKISNALGLPHIDLHPTDLGD